MIISRLNTKATGRGPDWKKFLELSLDSHVKITKHTNTHGNFKNL